MLSGREEMDRQLDSRIQVKDTGKIVCRESRGCFRDRRRLADSALFPAPRTHCLSSAMESGKVLEEGVSPLGRQRGVGSSASETESKQLLPSAL